jgi:hypothetical protein
MSAANQDYVLWPQSHLLLSADVHLQKRQGDPLDHSNLDAAYEHLKAMVGKKGMVTLGLEHHEVCGCNAGVWVIRTTIRVA